MFTARITQEQLCKKLEDHIDDKKKELDRKVKAAKASAFKNLSDTINKHTSWLPGPIDLKLDALNNLISNLTDGLAMPDLSNPLLACIGIDLNDIFGFDFGMLKDFNIGYGLPGIRDFVQDAINKEVDKILDKAESEILEAIQKLRDMIDTSLIDKILGLFLCLTQHCPDRKQDLVDLGVENKLEEIGADINGKIDTVNQGMSDIQNDHLQKIDEKKREITKVLDDKTAGVVDQMDIIKG
jgi:hypothetical protein